MTEKGGFTLIEVYGSAEQVLGGPQVVASQGSRDRIAATPKGWLTSIEIRSAMSDVGNETVEINGTQVFLRDALTEAGKALSAIRPDLQLPLLVQDIISFERVGRFIVCELSDAGKSRRSGRYPSSDQPVTVVFELTQEQISSYLISHFKTTSLVGIAVVIKNVGRTSVAIPQDAFDKLVR